MLKLNGTTRGAAAKRVLSSKSAGRRRPPMAPCQYGRQPSEKLRVWTVDDVLTTGATLTRCASVLDPGAKSVVAVTIGEQREARYRPEIGVCEGPSTTRGTRMSPARSSASESRGRPTPEATAGCAREQKSQPAVDPQSDHAATRVDVGRMLSG